MGPTVSDAGPTMGDQIMRKITTMTAAALAAWMAAGATAQDAFDACEIFTQADAQKVLGTNVDPEPVNPKVKRPKVIPTCTWWSSKDGKPVSYQAPKEGAIAWLDGLSLIKAAKNTDQVYALLEYLQTPEASAAVAEGSGYNPVVTGADALLSPAAKKNFQEAYPGDALKNLWNRPPEPSWFGELRTQYADKFKAA